MTEQWRDLEKIEVDGKAYYGEALSGGYSKKLHLKPGNHKIVLFNTNGQYCKFWINLQKDVTLYPECAKYR